MMLMHMMLLMRMMMHHHDGCVDVDDDDDDDVCDAGGFMWYAVFSYSMISMVFASLTMLGYLSIQLNEPLYAGPFYFVFPLPLALVYFWYYCEHKFKNVSMVRPPPHRADDANDDVDVDDDVDTLSDHEAVDEDDDTRDDDNGDDEDGDDCVCMYTEFVV